MNTPTLTLHGNTSSCTWTTGHVVGLTERRTTTVHGDQYGTSSRTDVEIQFFLSEDQRDAGPFTLWNWSIPLRNGQLVTWINGTRDGKYYAVALINHTNDRWYLVNSGFNITRFLGGYFYPGWKTWLILGTVLLPLTFLAGFLLALVPWAALRLVQNVRIRWAARGLSSQVQQIVELVVPQVVNPPSTPSIAIA